VAGDGGSLHELFVARGGMGAGQSAPGPGAAAACGECAAPPPAAAAAQGGLAAACPVKHAPEAAPAAASGVAALCPVKRAEPAAAAAATDSAAACPVKGAGVTGNVGAPVTASTLQQQYNVYAQPIDPSNRMPLNPNQLPAPGQKKLLSTERVKSFIPKGGTDAETWQYPSPQMFYNALVRKGKAEDVNEDEVETIVAVHNNMNEKAWNLIVAWERATHPEEFSKADGIKLSRFMGKPHDISPMAWFKSTFMGYPAPFDRHDWWVDRNGTEVRYVIDYYYNEAKGALDNKPQLHDARSVQSISMDARPAIDSPTAALDRVRYPVMQALGKVPVIAMEDNAPAKAREQRVKDAAAAQAAARQQTSFADLDAEGLRNFSAQIAAKCSDCFAKVSTCATEQDCQKASVALTHCMAELVCKPEAATYGRAPTDVQSLDNMVGCMGRFEEQALFIRTQMRKAADFHH
jgi:cytochrome c heme-lyase